MMFLSAITYQEYPAKKFKTENISFRSRVKNRTLEMRKQDTEQMLIQLHLLMRVLVWVGIYLLESTRSEVREYSQREHISFFIMRELNHISPNVDMNPYFRIYLKTMEKSFIAYLVSLGYWVETQ